jgi:bifunctional non-homologous end joining protein LigD
VSKSSATGGDEGSGKTRGSLERYRDKRDPSRTNEPFGPEHKPSSGLTRAGRFVVHLHEATRTHYDVRLEIGGTLRSFAVPRGPSLDPDDKRLAVHTEDHPMEYLDFEQVIPEGNYGAGPMIIWDRGRVSYLEAPAEEGLRNGKLDFWLSGFKLRGRFALIETEKRKGPGREDSKQWLLVKKKDEFSRKGRDIVREQPYSVLSGLDVWELGRKNEIARELEAEAASLGAKQRHLSAERLTPMLCATEPERLDDPERVYELKLDGVRIVADKQGDKVVLRYRNGRSVSVSYPEIAQAVAALAPERVVLDGEIVAFDERGRPSFERILPRIQALRPRDVLKVMAEVPVTYLVFDLLALGEHDLTELPLVERKRLLGKLVRGNGYLRTLDHVDDGERLYAFAQQERLEGIVSKRRDSPYRPGPRRSGDWVKIKLRTSNDFVVIGWLEGKGTRSPLGGLCIASYLGDRLIFRGRVGSGISPREIDDILARLRPLEQPSYPAEGPLPDDLKKAYWVRPELVARIEYQDFTEEGRLRAPVFCEFVDGADPKQCTAAPPDELIEAAAAPRPDAADQETETKGGLAVDHAKAKTRPVAKSSPRRVEVSNRDKIFWPDDGYTKGDLVDYYETIAPTLLPFLADRPVVMVRQPDGIRGKTFFQWNVPQGTPSWIRRGTLRDPDDPAGREKTVFLVDDVETLRHIANLGCIALHVLACREATRDQCDFITLDFDLGGQPFSVAVELAHTLKELLDDAGLTGYPKTSGQTGLHVLIPMGPGITFTTGELLAELLGRLVTERHPKVSTMERKRDKRGGRLYVDTEQTGQSRTIVSPYSVRAFPGATVSTPLDWRELSSALDPRRFTIMTVPERIETIGDPLATLLDQRPDIPQAVAKLGARLKK